MRWFICTAFLHKPYKFSTYLKHAFAYKPPFLSKCLLIFTYTMPQRAAWGLEHAGWSS